jgi:predicted amidohydrolase
VVARYSKMFPFSPYEQGTTPGDEFCAFDVPGVGCFGIAICYDLWFPEVARTLTAMGAEVILNPALAHFMDRHADLAIAQATGAMFQSYVFHINGLGAGGNGRSVIVDPAGRILHQAEAHEAFMPIEIDLDVVRRQRERGLLGLGQPLKSFRDSRVDFTVYHPERFDRSYLDGLGPLEKPGRAETGVTGS